MEFTPLRSGLEVTDSADSMSPGSSGDSDCCLPTLSGIPVQTSEASERTVLGARLVQLTQNRPDSGFIRNHNTDKTMYGS